MTKIPVKELRQISSLYTNNHTGKTHICFKGNVNYEDFTRPELEYDKTSDKDVLYMVTWVGKE